MPQQQTHNIAVYGTLKQGHGANDMLRDSTLLGRGLTHVKYIMGDVGYPMITRNDEGRPVVVEVYQNPNWKVLDRYEGVPRLYERNIIQIQMEDGGIEDAYIYEASKVRGRIVAPANNVLNWK